MSARQFVLVGQGEIPPMGEWQEVECPARLDLSGEFLQSSKSISYCIQIRFYILVHPRAFASFFNVIQK